MNNSNVKCAHQHNPNTLDDCKSKTTPALNMQRTWSSWAQLAALAPPRDVVQSRSAIVPATVALLIAGGTALAGPAALPPLPLMPPVLVPLLAAADAISALVASRSWTPSGVATSATFWPISGVTSASRVARSSSVTNGTRSWRARTPAGTEARSGKFDVQARGGTINSQRPCSSQP